MKERPILLNGDMVRAVLEGRKTQTRRVVKGLPDGITEIHPDPNCPVWLAYIKQKYGQECDFECLFGQVGDRLWVRETFQGPLLTYDEMYEQWKSDGTGEKFNKPEFCAYRATDKHPNAVDLDGYDIGWTPSIHMPRWASRITLEITGVRVERLHDISRGDCMQEGCPFPNIARDTDPKQWFSELWDSIYCTWEQNPWVWVIEFKVITNS